MKLPPAESRTYLRASPKGNLSAPPTANWGHRLPEGTRLDEFEITDVIGEGGFGIVYMAFDHSLQRRVALKEYMPSSLAMRVSGTPTVEVKFEHQTETFKVGLRSFVNEARLLAQFEHPALVKVHRFWEANGTAYMVMPYYEGPTLRAALAKLGHPPDEQWLRQLLDPLLDALSFLHAAQCFHRDVAPDNILLTPTGPLLLDFGAARRVIGAANQDLTVILKPGYAPIEQYGQATSLGQGPWTDIYALACMVYCAITGKAPMASIERFLGGDRLEPVSKLAAGRYNEHFLQAIDAGLAVKPEDRPKDIAEFRALLDAESSPHEATEIARTRPRVEPGSPGHPAKTKARTVMRKDAAPNTPASRAAPKRTRAIALGLGLAAVVAATAITGTRLMGTQELAPQTSASSQPPSSSSDGSTRQRVAQNTTAQDAPAVTTATQSQPSPGPVASIEASDQPGAPPADNLSVEKKQPEASGSAAKINEPRAALATTSGESSNVTPADKATDQSCNELIQKASLEPLSPEETELLKGGDCR